MADVQVEGSSLLTRAELAVIERNLNRPFLFARFPRQTTTASDERFACSRNTTISWYMPIITSVSPTAAAIARTVWRAPHYNVQRRHLFKLPDLSSFSAPSLPGTAKLQTYHERMILPYTRRQLYAVVSDMASYSSYVPFCTHSRVLGPPTPTPTPTTPNAQQMEVELTVAFLTFTERYTSLVTCVPCESVRAVASSSTPLFDTLETTWRFQPAPAHPNNATSVWSRSPGVGANIGSDDIGPTLVSLDLSFAFANPIHAAVSNTFFGKVSSMMVKAFKERCSTVYGPGRE